jgi:hypothetical protein
VVLEDGLARRGIKQITCESAQVVSSEISLVNALMNHPLLLDLRKATDSTSKAMVDKIVKTAAAIHLITDRYEGPYFAKPAARASTGVAERPGGEPM